MLLSGSVYRTDGIMGGRDGSRPNRDWLYNPDARIDNPACFPSCTAAVGQPSFIIVPNLADPSAIKGALISAGPLRGTAWPFVAHWPRRRTR